MSLPDRWIAIALAFGLCARLGLLWTDHQAADGMKFGQDEKSGDKISVVFVDDPKALVVLGPGPDGLPGRAGIDDGGNGTTDERTELGATGSDDVCRVVFGAEAASLASEAGGVLIVQRGAYRQLGESELAPAGKPTRELVRRIDDAGRPRERLRDR